MKYSHPVFRFFCALIPLGFAVGGAAQELLAPPAGEKLPANAIEVQTRGPVHEAFAQPFESNPMPGTVIPKEPPAPVNEEPPPMQLDSENAKWMPGYWAWNPERQEFMWVSGVFRMQPQGRTFVPGYWSRTDDGWRWITGYWSDSRQQEPVYGPEPPTPLNVDPTTAGPNDNSLYVPGTWMYRGSGEFSWRPGYWMEGQTARIWVPPHYVWTPAGYVFVDGYWDLPFENRGVMFAPVTFGQPLGPNAVYQPNYAVNYPGFLDSAYYLPGSGQFFFGNFSAPRYGRMGFRPWYAGAGQYNPLFAAHGLQNGGIAGVQRTYAARTNGTLAGPPLNLAAQTANNAVVVPLNQFRTGNQARLVQATPAQLNTQRTSAQQTRQAVVTRSQRETAVVARTTSRSSTQVLTFPSNNANRGIAANAGPQIINNMPKGNTLPAHINPANSAPRNVTPTHSPPVHTNTAPAHRKAANTVTPTPHVTAAPNQARVVHTPAPTVHRAARPVHAAHATHSTGGHGHR